MEKPSELVKWFFLFQKTESAMLTRIEFLVVVIAVLFLTMSLLDMFRRRSRNSTIKNLLLILDAICDSTFIYTIGLMQSAPFKKDLFPVWALILVNLRYNVCFISAYGIPDQDNRRITEAANVTALLGVAFLNSTFNSQFKYPIWALWAMQQMRSIYLVMAYTFATRSSLHGWSSPILTAYMNSPDGICEDRDPTTMKGYKYFVSGDHKQSVELTPPKYNFELKNHRERMLITLDKIWQPRGQHSNNDNGRNNIHENTTTDIPTPRMKDMCLSFALYRLLRCRFDDLTLPGDSIIHTRRLIYEIIGKNSTNLAAQINYYSERTFRIMKWELAFLNDYFYTRYPILFWRGFPLFAIWHPVLTIAFIIWLGRDIHKIYKPKAGETAHIIHGINVDIVITWVFMVIIVLKELWKMVAYLLSDWTKVMILCEYTAESLKCIPQWLWESFVWLLCTPRSRIVHRWHNKIDQYEFLQSFVYNPWKWNILYYLSLGLVPKRSKGEKPGKTIELPEDVKAAIVKSLCSLDLEQSFLPEKIPSLESNLPSDPQHFEWPFKLQTWSHSILVWHIATSLCEIELAQHYNTSLTISEVLRAIKSAVNCCSSQPYVIKEERIEGALRANYIVANSVSRYCAYLLMSEPDLLPDSYLIADDIFRSTVAGASYVLNGCDTLQSIYRTLIREGERQHNGGDNNVNVENAERSQSHPNMILKKGAQLGWSLINKLSDDIARWKFLAEVWADILVHTAPSCNAAAHKKCLATGGEFITHIWAILSHCNVQSSKRWPKQEVPHEDETAKWQGVGGGNQAPAQQRPTAGGDQVLAQEAAARDDQASSSGARQDHQAAAATSNPIPGQHLTARNYQQLAICHRTGEDQESGVVVEDPEQEGEYNCAERAMHKGKAPTSETGDHPSAPRRPGVIRIEEPIS